MVSKVGGNRPKQLHKTQEKTKPAPKPEAKAVDKPAPPKTTSSTRGPDYTKQAKAAEQATQKQREERAQKKELPTTSNASASLIQARLNRSLPSDGPKVCTPENPTGAPMSMMPQTNGPQMSTYGPSIGPAKGPTIGPAPEGTDLNKAKLDMSKPISVRTVKGAIDMIANERGESGSLDIHLEGSARVSGAVSVGAWGDLGLSVSKTDTGATTLSFNYEAAVKAGLDVGFMKVEGAVGANGSAKVRFNNSADAAAWLTKNFHNINEKADGKLFQIQGSNFNYQKPTVVKESGRFAQFKGETKFGPFDVTGRVRGQATDQTFTTPDGKTYKGRDTSFTGEVGATVDFGKVKVNGQYTFTQNTQTGDPVGENNGTYRNHKVSIKVPLKELKGMSEKEIKGALVGLAMMNDLKTPGSVKNLSDKALDTMAKNIKTMVDNPPAAGLEANVGITYEANNVKEGDKYNNQYQRIYLDLEGGFKAQADIGAAKGEFSTTISKSELLGEFVGTNTESYSQQIYTRSLDPNGNRADWQEFKSNNREALAQIVKNRVEANPNGSVARAYGNGDVNAGIRALEQDWSRTHNMDQGLRQDATTLANMGNQWWTSGGDERKYLDIIGKYQNNPKKLATLLDYMEGQGMTRAKLKSGTGGVFSTNDEELQRYYNIADRYKRENP